MTRRPILRVFVWVCAVAVAVSLAGSLAGCATPELSGEQAAAVAVDAFAAAGLDASRPSGITREVVDLASQDPGESRSGEVWLMTLEVEGREWTVGVDPERGSVVRTFEPAGVELGDGAVEALATYRHNPEARSASRTRRAVAIGVVVVVLCSGYLVLRTLARRSAAQPVLGVVDVDD